MHNAQLLKKRILYIVHFRFKQSSLYALGGYYYFVMKKTPRELGNYLSLGVQVRGL